MKKILIFEDECQDFNFFFAELHDDG